MGKETRITAPEGCEIEKVEIVDGAAVITFKEKERKLPKSFEEFCAMFPDYSGEYYIEPKQDEKINQVLMMFKGEERTNQNSELLPDRATAEAVLAMIKLIQLRNCYNGDWRPDWSEGAEKKYCIDFLCGDICNCINCTSPLLLYFKNEELRDEFLRNFRPLIEKLKPLYGIKEGGEE